MPSALSSTRSARRAAPNEGESKKPTQVSQSTRPAAEIRQMCSDAAEAFDDDASPRNAAIIATLEWVLDDTDVSPLED